jgi:hypothetical protein
MIFDVSGSSVQGTFDLTSGRAALWFSPPTVPDTSGWYSTEITSVWTTSSLQAGSWTLQGAGNGTKATFNFTGDLLGFEGSPFTGQWFQTFTTIYGDHTGIFNIAGGASAEIVPIPDTLPLFAAGLLLFACLRKRKC